MTQVMSHLTLNQKKREEERDKQLDSLPTIVSIYTHGGRGGEGREGAGSPFLRPP